MIPDAKLESVPWNARLTANPTAPINTEKLSVSNPNLFNTNVPAINKIAQRVNFAKKRARVGSISARAQAFTTKRRTQLAAKKATMMMTHDQSTGAPYFIPRSIHSWDVI